LCIIGVDFNLKHEINTDPYVRYRKGNGTSHLKTSKANDSASRQLLQKKILIETSQTN
jgi:hypothetical protein